ncbi:hypothetical protein LRV42_004559 [Salmonella enterica subsp. enterica serovar Muenchen]|nr:hypothetical protein [Salmonella enterica subsp. enterica serovar Muenchen]MCN3464612.1 hypothetical protein [Escherichia coli]HAM8684606.1 hypothetical protein [Escherichia coli]
MALSSHTLGRVRCLSGAAHFTLGREVAGIYDEAERNRHKHERAIQRWGVA